MSDWHGICETTGKVRYPTRHAAKEVAKRRRGQLTHDVQPFPCDDCSMFHLGGRFGMTRAEHREKHGAAGDTSGMPIDHAARYLGVGVDMIHRLISEGKVRGNDTRVESTDIQRIHTQILRTP